MTGIGFCPNTNKQKNEVKIRPWFETDAGVNEHAHVLPHQSTWRPTLPGAELKVDPRNDVFRSTLAEPE